jgi:hypothetical protein
MVEAESAAAAHALRRLSTPLLADAAGATETARASQVHEAAAAAAAAVAPTAEEVNVGIAVGASLAGLDEAVLGPAFEAGLQRRGLLLPVRAAWGDPASRGPLDAAAERAAMAAGPLGSGAAPEAAAFEAAAALAAAVAALAASPAANATVASAAAAAAANAKHLRLPVAYALYAANRDAHGDFAAGAAAALALPALATQAHAAGTEAKCGEEKLAGGRGSGGQRKAGRREHSEDGLRFDALPVSVSVGLAQWGKGWLRQLQPCAMVDLGHGRGGSKPNGNRSKGEEEEDNDEDIKASDGVGGRKARAAVEDAWLLSELLGGALSGGAGGPAVAVCMRGRASSSGGWADGCGQVDEGDESQEEEAEEEGSFSEVDKENPRPAEAAKASKKHTEPEAGAAAAATVRRESKTVPGGNASRGMLAFALSESAFDFSTGPLLASTGGGGVFYLALGEVRVRSFFYPIEFLFGFLS